MYKMLLNITLVVGQSSRRSEDQCYCTKEIKRTHKEKAYTADSIQIKIHRYVLQIHLSVKNIIEFNKHLSTKVTNLNSVTFTNVLLIASGVIVCTSCDGKSNPSILFVLLISVFIINYYSCFYCCCICMFKTFDRLDIYNTSFIELSNSLRAFIVVLLCLICDTYNMN